VASLRDIPLDAVEFSIRGYFDRRGGRIADVPNCGIEEIRYETRIQSPAASDRVRELVEEAERHCYVLHTLRRAARLFGRILLNGDPLMEVAHGTE
jgi:predicted  nucleic acid-binding Zn-ribbon protein